MEIYLNAGMLLYLDGGRFETLLASIVWKCRETSNSARFETFNLIVS